MPTPPALKAKGYVQKEVGFDPRIFRMIKGKKFVRVTQVLSIVDKPALVHWAANQEREAFQTALLEVLAGPHAKEPEKILDEVIRVSTGTKAMQKSLNKAGDIGHEAHELIQWWTDKILKKPNLGPEPKVCAEAANAVEAWKKWAKEVKFKPLAAEMEVYSELHGYAGQADCLCLVEGRETLLDYKTGKGIYDEAFLQNVAYRYALAEMYVMAGGKDVTEGGAGWMARQGMILRLPKKIGDPEFEFKVVPDEPSMEDNFERFLAAKKLWVWKRRSEGKDIGDVEPPEEKP